MWKPGGSFMPLGSAAADKAWQKKAEPITAKAGNNLKEISFRVAIILRIREIYERLPGAEAGKQIRAGRLGGNTGREHKSSSLRIALYVSAQP
jgi:hypothetical protein